MGVGNFIKHTKVRNDVGTKATFAAVLAVSVCSAVCCGVMVAAVEGIELGGYTGEILMTVSAL